METSAWKPLALVTARGNRSGNRRPDSHQVRVRGCEPEVRTCYRYAPKCVPTVRTELRTCCAQFAQLLRIPEAVAEAEHLRAARASRGPVREYAA